MGQRKKGKHIEVFSDDCAACQMHITNVEIGKCAGCKLEIIDLNSIEADIQTKINNYGVIKHPTTIIDQEIKVEGTPNFYWLCGDEFYDKLRKEYPLTI